MDCRECGAETSTRKENHRYRECGLSSVTLTGVDVLRCPRCGDVQVAIPYVEELHRLIARALVEKTTRFRADEVRFLRKSLSWSSTDFARHMGVAEETVSRWENDAMPIGAQADRLLRLMVAQGRLTMNYPLERLAEIDARRATATKVEVKAGDQEWVLSEE